MVCFFICKDIHKKNLRECVYSRKSCAKKCLSEVLVLNIFNRTHFYIFIWAVFIFTCTELGPYFSNDFRYMLIQGTTDFVGSIGDIFVSQWRHYFEWGGRTPNHLLAQFLLYIGKPWSAIATGLCFAALVVVIYCHGYCCSVSRALKNLKFWPVVFIIFSLWLCLRLYCPCKPRYNPYPG